MEVKQKQKEMRHERRDLKIPLSILAAVLSGGVGTTIYLRALMK